MAYKITITEKKVVPSTSQRWALLNSTTGEHGYVPAPEGATTTQEREVLTQEVDALDLAAVIRAVNNL